MTTKNIIITSAIFAAINAATAATLAVDADAYIRSGTSADTNFGSETSLILRGDGPSDSFKAYFSADFGSELSVGESFSSSSFSVTTNSLSQGAATTLVLYGIVDNADSWTEGAITWNNAPKNDTSSGQSVLATGTVELATLSIPALASSTTYTLSDARIDDYLNWTVGNIAGSYGFGASSDNIATFILTSTGGGNMVRLLSSQGSGISNPSINYTAVPEPSQFGAAIGLLALASCAFHRRRK